MKIRCLQTPAAALLVTVLLAACSSTISIDSRESTELVFDAALVGPARVFLVDVLTALREQGAGVFDLPRVAAVAEERGLALEDLAEPEPGGLQFTASLNDLSTLAAALGSPSFTVQLVNGREEVLLSLRRPLVDDLLTLLPESERGALELFLPEAGSTREEYLDYLAWLLEGYGETRELVQLLEQTTLVLILSGNPGWRLNRAEASGPGPARVPGGYQIVVPLADLLLGTWFLDLFLVRP